MSTDPFAPRNLVRKRIIRRNTNFTLMKTFQALQLICMLAMFPLFFAAIMGVITMWSVAGAMFMMMASLGMYCYYWFKMIDNVSNNPRDRKFLRKMLNEEFW